MSDRHAVIIGGGVSGLSTAYHLTRAGYGRVTVLEKDHVGAGSSSRAAAIATGLLWTPTGVAARALSLRLFRQLSNQLPGYRFYNEHGCLGLLSPELWPARESLLPLYDDAGVPYQVMSPDEIRRRWPALHPADGYVGLHDPLGGYSEPDDYLSALERQLRALGVAVRDNVVVREFELTGDRVTGVRTDDDRIRADAVVVTTHSWILPLLATVGISVPVKTFVHQRYVSRPLPQPIAIPPVNADPFLGYIRPAHGGRILIGRETPDRDDWKVSDLDFTLDALDVDSWILDDVVAQFADFAPALVAAQWDSRKVGLIQFSMDGEPVIGPVPGMENLFVGAAFHSGGFAYNPAVGYLLAEFVATGKTSIDVSAFSPGRFEADETAEYLASTVPQSQAARRRH